ncbi:unnamed protein product [Cuscuta campestris]|uniref:RNase H type-1 domain-containing protein n=1 Tax=Cuscuta campestris TaxID=132261 RepID=A0A484MQK3_9ASTE|nr:unnamed protein product [Cuscuta campestris]
MNHFWRSNKGSDLSGIHWLLWQRMSMPKQFGGQGFRRIRDFNVAMIGKQGWRLMVNPNSLVGRVFKLLDPRGLLLSLTAASVGHRKNRWSMFSFSVLLLRLLGDSYTERSPQACWELKVVTPEVATDWAREVCMARTSRDIHGGTMVTSEGLGLQHLNRPDLLRCFVDAAMFQRDGSASVAAALLDGAGTFIRGFNKLVTCPLVSRYVETLAIKEALSWLKEKNIHDVAIFSNCVQVC